MRSDLSHKGRGEGAAFAISGHYPAYAADKQFANLGHADRAVAEQVPGDRALHAIFREPERIGRRDPMIDHQPRQQQPPRIAALSWMRPASHASVTALAT